MSQPKLLSWLQASQSVANSFMLSAKQSSRTSNFNVFCLTWPRIEPPTSCMPGERSTTTLPSHSMSVRTGFWPWWLYQHCTSAVEPVLKDHPIGHKNVVCQDRWSLVTGSVIFKCRSFWWKCMVCQDRWSLVAVVSRQLSLYHTSMLGWWTGRIYGMSAEPCKTCKALAQSGISNTYHNTCTWGVYKHHVCLRMEARWMYPDSKIHDIST